MKTIIVLLLIGIVFVVPQVFAQTSSLDEMMNNMRFTHSQLSNNIENVIQLVKIQ